MIAHARPPQVSRSEAQAAFLEMLPTIRTYAAIAFRRFTAEARDDAIAEVIAGAFLALVSLLARGRGHLAFPTVLARYAIAQFHDGRRVAERQNVRDVSSPYARRKKRIVLERLDRFDPEQDAWREAVVEDTQTPVADQVWFRIDFPEWLGRLSARKRRVAEALALGHSTSEVARRYGISAARVSQLRSELHDAWHRFQGELEPELATC